jgi:hypothetical protein
MATDGVAIIKAAIALFVGRYFSGSDWYHQRHFGTRRVLIRLGRWLLAASVIAGWLLQAMASLSDVTLARLFAVLPNGVVITSLRAELPDEREGRFWPFCLAAVILAGLLLLT